MQKKLLVVGSMNVDMVVKAPRIPSPGETILGGVFSRFFGGKGANQAMAAKTLFADTLFSSMCGKDSIGDDYLNYLKSKGMDTSLVKRHDSLHSGVALITVDDGGENIITVAAGANLALSPSDMDDIDFSQFSHAAFQLETEIPTVMEGLKRAKEASCQTILTPAPAQKLPEEIFPLLDFIVPNQHEILLIQDGYNDAESAAKALLDKGVKNVIITLGSKGSALFNADGRYDFGTFHTPRVDTVGAGDCFTGSLMAGLALFNGDIKKAITFSTAAASIAVSKPGAQNFGTFDEVLALSGLNKQ